MSDYQLEAELRRLIGDEDFLKILERYAGIRLYMPLVRGELNRLIGSDNVARLAVYYGRSYIRVPLARDFRFKMYRQQGLSNAKIALKLGITETAVDKIVARMNARPVKGAQLDMFETGGCGDGDQRA